MNSNSRNLKRKSLCLTILALISAIAIPICIIIFSAYQTLMTPSLYTNILKQADLISTFIRVRNLRLDTESRQRIEEELHLSKTQTELKEAKDAYNTEKYNFDTLNRTKEYDELKIERRETANLSWSRTAGLFNDKAELKAYKENRLADIDNRLRNIEDYRKSNKASLRLAKNSVESAEKKAKALTRELKSKEKKAEKILKKNKKSFSGKLFADIEAITPELTEVLNEKIIDGQIYEIAENLIAFISSKTEQAGNIFYEINPATGLAELKIRVPKIEIDLRSDGRHLLSDIFAGIIREHKELNNTDFLIKIFRFTETGLGEKIGSSFLKKIGLRLHNDRLFLENRVLSGQAAEILYTVMTAASMKNFFRFVVPAIATALLLLMLIYPAPWRQRITSIYRVLAYSSAAALFLWGIGFVLINSGKLSLGDIYASAYLQPALSTIYLSIMLPKAFVIFLIMMTAGSIIRFLVLRKQNGEITK